MALAMLDPCVFLCYNVPIDIKNSNMDVFTSLSQRTKVVIVASALFLLITAVGLLVFGDNIVTDESDLLQQAQGAVRADMLYSHPAESH
jgi:hypothetical protein